MRRKVFQSVELYIFLIFSIISILPFFLVKYIPSLDGPQHLYNARLIAELIKGNEFISQYFMFNHIVVGNMSSLFVMAFLMLVFPAWIAEKIFLSMYVIGLALSFRYFIRSVQKTGSLLYLLIFPFAFTSLFMMGYYNFCLAFIPFFLALGYLRRHETRLGFRGAAWLAVMCLLIYLSHAIVFVFFGLIILLQMIFDLGYFMINPADGMKGWFSVVKKYLIILVCAIPAIILWVNYYLFLHSGDLGSSPVSSRPVSEILNDLYNIRILVGFHHEEEAGPNIIMFWSLVALVLLAIIPLHQYFPRMIKPARRNNPDWLKWTFISIVLLILAIFSPDRMFTGSMSARLSILFFLAVITWISLQSYPKLIMVISLVLILVSFTWHRKVIHRYYSDMNLEIADLEEAGKFIKPRTILFPINCSENWLQLHFHCYLGVDKPIVDLGNPQPNGPMPLVWNYTKMPDTRLGSLDQQQSGTDWVAGNNYLTPVSADYIFVWRSQQMDADEGVKALINKINPYYTKAFRSENGNALLYQLNDKN